MRLSPTDLLPVLTIIAGGVVGASLTLSFLVLWSPDEDVAEQMTADAQSIPQPFAVTFDSVYVDGNIRLPDSRIIAMGGLDHGSAYTFGDIDRAGRSMWATEEFAGVYVRIRGDDRRGELVTLTWVVNEMEGDELPERINRDGTVPVRGTGVFMPLDERGRPEIILHRRQ